MGSVKTSQPIVRTFIDAAAPTGECERYVTADGYVWQPSVEPARSTGVRSGWIDTDHWAVREEGRW